MLGQVYDLVMFVIVVLAVAKLAAIWNQDVRQPSSSRSIETGTSLPSLIGWAILPTVALSVASFAHPIYANRYVTASAPGAALLVAFVC